jgi:putative oxidoreductase
MVTSNKALRWITFSARVALGVIFVYAAWIKLSLPWELFAMSIDSYQLLPTSLVEILARTLPWFELLLGLVLISGKWLRVTSAVTSLLLLVFFTLIVRAALKGQEISCGCFGPGETISWKTMLRDGSMLAGSLLVTAMAFLRRRTPRPLEPASLQPHSTPPEPAPNLPPSESQSHP